jgi:hypothetical protein
MEIYEDHDMKKKNNNLKQNDIYEYHGAFDTDGITIVGKNGKFGFVRQNGEEITPLKYDKAMRFYQDIHILGINGRALPSTSYYIVAPDIGKVCLNGKWGLVNMAGKEITPLIYDEIKWHQNPIVKLNGKYGYVNGKTGELLTPVKYDKAREWTDADFGNHDLAQVQLDGKWGCIDVHGKEIIPLKYDKIQIHQSKEAPCVTARLKRKWGFIDLAGKEIAPFEYDSVEPFNACRARVKKRGKYGFINNKGAIVIPIIYDDCESDFIKDDEHIHPIAVALEGKYGYIDVDGNEIVPPMYEYAASFYYSDIAAVVLNGKVGFIDETGKGIIPFIYDPLDNPDDYKRIIYFRGNFLDVKLNGKWGVIDRDNNVIIPFLYDEFLDNRCAAGWHYAIRDGKKLSVDTKGNEYLMQKNPYARTFKDYLHAVTLLEVVESGRTLLGLSPEKLNVLEINFNNFFNKSSRPSKNIIRIHSSYYYNKKSPIDTHLYSEEDECAYVYFDWAEILDMEARVEDNLTLSDAEIVACCIWQWLTMENFARRLLTGLTIKTEDENRTKQ